MCVRVRLRELSAYGKLNMNSFSSEIAGTTVGVRLREVSVSGGSTVCVLCVSVFVRAVSTFFSPDVDECTDGSHNCSVNAWCNNMIGSFNCTCNLGFDGDGVNCTAGKLVRPDFICSLFFW